VPETLVRPTVTSELETRLHTISQEILSRSRLEELIRRFGLYPDLRDSSPMEDIIERLRRDVSLELKASEGRGHAGTTTSFALSYRGRDPQTVAVVTNTLASFYIEENLKVRERQAAGTAQFLKSQLGEAKQRLDEQERKVSAFRAQHLGELPQQMTSNMTQLESLNNQLRLNADQQVRAAERRQAIRLQLAEASSLGPTATMTAGGIPAGPETPGMRLARLRQELSAARARFHPEHPTLLRLQAEVAVAQEELTQAKPDSHDRDEALASSPYVLRLREVLQAANAEVRILKSEEDRLKQTIGALQRRVENTPRREQEFQDLARDYDATTLHYQSLLKRHEEAQLAESMEQRQKGEQFRILDPAVPGSTPSAPRRERLIAMCLVVSAALAVGVMLLAEMLDTSFHSIQELREFTIVPVLVSIPRIVTEGDRRLAQRRFRLMAVGTAVGLLLVIVLSYAMGRGNDTIVTLLGRGA
jgi:polysaccharide chain length determinant protein (PEP-CTERM system associated)